jgi:hypothetical protein
MKSDVGRLLMIAGLLAFLLGAGLSIAGKLPWLGRLPGDIVIQRRGFTVYLPFGTCVILSLLLTLLFWFFRR